MQIWKLKNTYLSLEIERRNFELVRNHVSLKRDPQGFVVITQKWSHSWKVNELLFSLKPENIIIGDNMSIKIMDYTLSQIVEY
jgi:hypothetical protein